MTASEVSEKILVFLQVVILIYRQNWSEIVICLVFEAFSVCVSRYAGSPPLGMIIPPIALSYI